MLIESVDLPVEQQVRVLDQTTNRDSTTYLVYLFIVID